MSIIAASIDKHLTDYCRQHHIRWLSVFGSQARGNARADSDIDLLVEFDEGMSPGLIGLAEMEADISDLLGGIKTTCAHRANSAVTSTTRSCAMPRCSIPPEVKNE